MRIPLNQAIRTAFLLAAMAASSVSFAVTAHAESGSRRAIDADAAGARNGAVVVDIDKTTQTMTVFLGGVEKYEWPVSTGRPGYSTPSGTYTATSMNEIWYSKRWDNAPMPHAVFFMRDGHAIHGSFDVGNLRQAGLAWLRAHLAQECRHAFCAGEGERPGEYAGHGDRG